MKRLWLHSVLSMLAIGCLVSCGANSEGEKSSSFKEQTVAEELSSEELQISLELASHDERRRRMMLERISALRGESGATTVGTKLQGLSQEVSTTPENCTLIYKAKLGRIQKPDYMRSALVKEDGSGSLVIPYSELESDPMSGRAQLSISLQYVCGDVGARTVYTLNVFAFDLEKEKHRHDLIANLGMVDLEQLNNKVNIAWIGEIGSVTDEDVKIAYVSKTNLAKANYYETLPSVDLVPAMQIHYAQHSLTKSARGTIYSGKIALANVSSDAYGRTLVDGRFNLKGDNVDITSETWSMVGSISKVNATFEYIGELKEYNSSTSYTSTGLTKPANFTLTFQNDSEVIEEAVTIAIEPPTPVSSTETIGSGGSGNIIGGSGGSGGGTASLL